MLYWESKIDLPKQCTSKISAVWLIQEFEKLERKQDRYSPRNIRDTIPKPRYPK